jgi:hypothetical protein
MSGRYGAGVTNRTGVNTVDTVLFQIRPTSTAERLYVVQVVMAVLTAPSNALQPYLTRSTAIGTVTTTLAGQPLDPNETAAVGTFDSIFSVAPTIVTTNKIGVGAMAVTAGGGWVWDFRDRPVVLSAVTTAGLCIVNAAASGATVGAVSASVMWDE